MIVGLPFLASILATARRSSRARGAARRASAPGSYLSADGKPLVRSWVLGALGICPLTSAGYGLPLMRPAHSTRLKSWGGTWSASEKLNPAVTASQYAASCVE